MEDREARREEIDRRITDRYRVHPGQEDAFRNDPQFHNHVTLLRDMLQAVDASLAAEGMDLTTRDRVCCRLLYGEAPEGFAPPDFREAHNRMTDRLAAQLRAASESLGRLTDPRDG